MKSLSNCRLTDALMEMTAVQAEKSLRVTGRENDRRIATKITAALLLVKMGDFGEPEMSCCVSE